jgi:hypothetical protein
MGKPNRSMPEKTNDPIKDAKAAVPAEPKIEITYNTRFFSPPHEEIDAAAHWLRQRFPELTEEMLNECLCDRLNMDGFNKGTVVYVLVRKSFGRRRLKDAQTFREAPDGARITVLTPIEELSEEIRIFGPVNARDHWTSDERGWNSELNRGSFLSEIGKLASPWAVLQPDAPSKKNGELPKFCVLATC